MKRILRWVALVCVGAMLGAGSACRKGPPTDPAVVEGASKLPGAAEVMAAIDKKDFEGAMAALAKVKEGLTSEDQNVQFMVLARQARDKITETGGDDPKAAEAVAALRAMTTGGR